ncbi:rRNA maturation RNase YbeY [Halioglobus japonicus]|uniref:Endoribonuclease YbeY n=1 Tax=Halioglobus japonicus TaxID=930805 RepID=A0AAP8MDK4_9GAMM|nr:rRNA maturation RNase YbeY [Halioglobus japonicus]AQA17880.1 rRNA maturation RNase YbeY [Halioglobus japonicus]PLW85842.1 rRNA maturation RNase YbeY [Halioglobus japonicus]GHD17782.1 endoribonuclease YbeY [Halioglobus japonicus]
MNLEIDIQRETSDPAPDEDDIRRWIQAALATQRKTDTEVSVRLVDEDEMAELNHTWRGKSGPTNVLSFPSDLPPELELPLLGDIVVCTQVVIREASEQHKTLEAHWAHMLVHGTLHLLGYDHIEDEEAQAMEVLETRILTELNYPCPYRGDQLEEHQSA